MKYPYKFQQQDIPLLEQTLAILMLSSFMNDLLIDFNLQHRDRFNREIIDDIFISIHNSFYDKMLENENNNIPIDIIKGVQIQSVSVYITLIISKYCSGIYNSVCWYNFLDKVYWFSIFNTLIQISKGKSKFLVGFTESKIKQWRFDFNILSQCLKIQNQIKKILEGIEVIQNKYITTFNMQCIKDLQ
ncbi:unnamed protein product [Paramecium sonneborni]|uniref:Uncharacterized protein n=1 Tax=Paramecium sonneborni TaxID=65129 RepID=A0A8S1QP43_9CILI|nr:unnamed protein product [Paramecium sonneborni]